MELINKITTFFNQHYEWFFSGAGIAILGFIISLINKSKKHITSTQELNEIKTIAKKANSKSTIIVKNSQVGVIGNDTKVEGEISISGVK